MIWNFNLPTNKDEVAVFWEASDGAERSRGILTSDGDGHWSIDFQLGWEDDDGEVVWSGGRSFDPEEFSEFYLTLAKAFAGACNRNHADLLDMTTKGKSEFPVKPGKHVTIVRGANKFNVRLTEEGGTSEGHPLMGLVMKRPISAEEGFVLMRRLTKASDWYRKRREG